MEVSEATRAVAAEALGQLGGHDGVTVLATGMSSAAFVGSVNGDEYAVRVPIGVGRRPTPDYAREARLLADLGDRGAPVSVPIVVEVRDRVCSVAPRIIGRRVEPNDWTHALVDHVASFLAVLHETEPAFAVEPDVLRRFHLARIWPFDGSDLGDHPVARIWPDGVGEIEDMRSAIETAGSRPSTVVHTDLHSEHLLVDGAGSLAGVLDFGDAFAGPPAWDHACIRYYHGDEVAVRVAEAMDTESPSADDVDLLSVAWALYKLAKTPDRPDVRTRVDRLLQPDRNGA